jgi:hypothetical protein
MKKDEGLLVTALLDFFAAIGSDPRITALHISLYTALLHHWQSQGLETPLTAFSRQVMPLCKISGSSTYHRTIRELHQYGYISYVPSYNHFLGSLVYFLPIPQTGQEGLRKEATLYFLLRDKADYKIIKAGMADVDFFRQKHGSTILVEGDSLAELLVQFSAKMEGSVDKAG